MYVVLMKILIDKNLCNCSTNRHHLKPEPRTDITSDLQSHIVKYEIQKKEKEPRISFMSSMCPCVM